MAEKKSRSSEGTNIRRIKATDDRPKTPVKPTAKSVAQEPRKITKPAVTKDKVGSENKSTGNPIKSLGGYFKGAWYELMQVRWPDRSATWSMTLAVLLFTAIFIVIIILLDSGFKWIFEQVLS